MAQEKRKGRSPRKPTSIRSARVLASCFLGIILAGTLIYLVWPTPREAPPLYEESYFAPTDLITEIARIDRAIFESLYQRGIPEGQVRFLAVEPRQEGGQDWEFSEMRIKVPEGDPGDRLEEALAKAVTALKPNVEYQKERLDGGEKVWHVFALGCYTHKIRLAPEDLRKTPEQRVQPRIAIVIDDLGYDLEMARAFIHLGAPVTLSVLPIAPQSVRIAQEATERGHEVLLHLPMEPKGYPRLSPGPGGLLVGMKEETIRSILNEHLTRIPGVRGVNNHMGSRFTETETGMSVVFEELKKRGLFYLDSRTTPRSVASELGRKRGIPVLTRSVFLDHRLSPGTVRFQSDRLMGIARSTGSAVGIGHPHMETLRSLRESLPRMKSMASIVPLSDLIAESNKESTMKGAHNGGAAGTGDRG